MLPCHKPKRLPWLMHASCHARALSSLKACRQSPDSPFVVQPVQISSPPSHPPCAQHAFLRCIAPNRNMHQ
eukprot:1152459-Pelagomonas_calceolata.AAC.1